MAGISHSDYLTPYILYTHTHHLLSSFLAVHEPLGNDTRSEELVTLAELLEEDSVGETESADSDALQDTIAAELVKDKRSNNLASLQVIRHNAM